MASASVLFSFLIKATAPEGTKYVAGRRYEMIVFVRHLSMDEAKSVARNVIEKLAWMFPEVVEAAQLDGQMELKKAKGQNIEAAIMAAAKQGHSVVVFD